MLRSELGEIGDSCAIADKIVVASYLTADIICGVASDNRVVDRHVTIINTTTGVIDDSAIGYGQWTTAIDTSAVVLKSVDRIVGESTVTHGYGPPPKIPPPALHQPFIALLLNVLLVTVRVANCDMLPPPSKLAFHMPPP